MVQLEDQLGPATSSSGPGNSKGKQRHAAVGQPRQVLKPGWVSRKPAATSLDNNNAQPSVSPESRSKVNYVRIDPSCPALEILPEILADTSIAVVVGRQGARSGRYQPGNHRLSGI